MGVEVRLSEIVEQGNFRLAHALWVLRLFLPEWTPRLMQSAMEHRAVSPDVVEVAGLVAPTRLEHEAVIARAFVQVSGADVTEPEAKVIVQNDWANRFLSAADVHEAERLLRQVNELFTAVGYEEGPFSACALACDQLDWDAPDRPSTDLIISYAREAVRKWIEANSGRVSR